MQVPSCTVHDRADKVMLLVPPSGNTNVVTDPDSQQQPTGNGPMWLLAFAVFQYNGALVSLI